MTLPDRHAGGKNTTRQVNPTAAACLQQQQQQQSHHRCAGRDDDIACTMHDDSITGPPAARILADQRPQPTGLHTSITSTHDAHDDDDDDDVILTVSEIFLHSETHLVALWNLLAFRTFITS